MDVKEVVFAFLLSRGEISGETEAEQLACEYLDTGVLDSMGIVDMILEFEERFDIHFEPEHLQSVEFRTIGGVIQLIERLIEEKTDD